MISLFNSENFSVNLFQGIDGYVLIISVSMSDNPKDISTGSL